MSGLATVAPAILTQINRIAKGKQNAQSSYSGNGFWSIVDSAADESYENIVKGTTITAIDTVLRSGTPWAQSSLAQWFVLHEQYYVQVLSLGTWTAFINLVWPGVRVPYEFAEALRDARGSGNAVSPVYVYPKGTRVTADADVSAAGYHKFGSIAGSTFTATDGVIDKTRCVGGILLGVNDAGTTSATSLKVLVTQATTTGTDVTKSIDVTLAGAGANKHTFIGGSALTSSAAAGQKTLTASGGVTQFTANTYALVYESDSLHEVVTISAVGTGALTTVSNLVNTYTTAATVYPLVINAVRDSGSVTNGPLSLYALPDRTIALN